MEENKKAIPITESDELNQGERYIAPCGIEFVYDAIGNQEKPFLLNNTYRLNHFPTTKDKPTNNLTSIASRSKEEIKEITSKGGKKSAEVQQARRSFKDSMNMILSIKASKETIESLPIEVQQYINNNGIIPTYEDLINIKAVLLGMDGSVNHMVFSRDTVGEKPTDKQEITAEVVTDADRKLLENIEKRLNGSSPKQ